MLNILYTMYNICIYSLVLAVISGGGRVTSTASSASSVTRSFGQSFSGRQGSLNMTDGALKVTFSSKGSKKGLPQNTLIRLEDYRLQKVKQHLKNNSIGVTGFFHMSRLSNNWEAVFKEQLLLMSGRWLVELLIYMSTDYSMHGITVTLY
jgi:hypothetical protein